MYLTDLHTHSILSMDGNVPLADMVQAAVDGGLSALTVTDHCDLLTETGQRNLTYDWQPALSQFAETAARFSDFRLGLGIELGSIHVSPPHARAILAGAGPALDQVIGSIHNWQEKNGGGEYYYVRFDTPALCRAMLDDYFSSMQQLVELPDCYDVLGHIIYPLRYIYRDGQEFSLFPTYRDPLAHILRRVIETGHSIEVNTCRGNTVEDWREILLLYRDLGGTQVTTGSDAHRPQDVGKGIRESCDLLKSCGFDHITVYHRRQAELITI